MSILLDVTDSQASDMPKGPTRRPFDVLSGVSPELSCAQLATTA